MGRMFRVITEGPIEAVTAGAALAHARREVVETEDFLGEDVPFIEVGGPSAVFHAPKKSAHIEHTPPPVKHQYRSVSLQPLNSKPAQAVAPVAAEIVAFHQPDHPVAGEYEILAVEMAKQLSGTGPHAVHFASPERGLGTTTVILNLAVTLANRSKVLVIDAAFGQAGAAKAMGLGEIPGLAEVLNQSVPLAWALQPTPKPSLQVLAAGRSVSEPALADFPKLIAQLKQWFDWILIDGGVWGAHSSRDALVAHSDAVYAVAERPDTAGALRQAIPRHGGLLRGVVTARRD